jgi:hypothetical protein
MSVYYAGQKVGTLQHAGIEVVQVICGGQEIYPATGPQLDPLRHRITDSGGQKWFEVCWNSPEILSGNAESGWVDPGGYCQLEIERSENLVNWATAEVSDCAVTAILQVDGTYDYWARSKFPIDSAVKSGLIRLRSGEATGESGLVTADARNNPLTGLTIAGVVQALAGFPYTMPGDAARMQTDIRALGWTGATVTASAATVWEIIIPGVSLTSYTQRSRISWPQYLIADLFGTVNTPVNGADFTGVFVNAAGLRTSINKQFFRMKVTAKKRLSVGMLAAKMIEGVDSRLAVAAPPSSSMKLFTGIVANYTGSTFVPNTANWLHDLRSQLTGFHMGADAWTQSYALIPLGDRYALSCGHNGPGPGTTVKYVSPTGVVFTTSILAWINDYPARSSSDTQQTYQTDLMVVVLADPLPTWVYRAPIIAITAGLRTALDTYDPPTVAISQGSWTAGPSTPYGEADTPDNRMAFVKSMLLKTPRTALRDPFHHGALVGDSGTPEYILIDDVLYLYRVITQPNETGVFVADWFTYINAMIARGAVVTGIPAIKIAPAPLHFV